MENTVQISEDLKDIMRDLPVPLTIVTAKSDNVKRGVTLSSFTMLSVEPPLISFNIDCKTQFCKFFKSVNNFAVHFPGQDHTDISKRFATSGLSGEEQFDEIATHENVFGTPILSDIGKVIYCTVAERIKIGDHFILIGQVVEVNNEDESPALLYHNRSFKTLNIETK